jgi:predicted enzyme related to lactoylglutathione lyase
MGAPVIQFEIVGGTPGQLEQFYGKLFNWKIDSNNPMKYGLVNTDSAGRGIAGGIAANQAGEHRVAVYVEVGDLQDALDKAETLGGKTVQPPVQIPGGPKLALFSDPAGNVIGLLGAQEV